MKAGRFIFNTDYITWQNDQEQEVTVTVPSSFSVAADEVKHFRATVAMPGSSSRNYRAYFTTSMYPKATTGCVVCTLAFGDDYLMVALTHNRDSFTLDIYNDEQLYAHTFSGPGGTVTAHIQTFIDPFQV